MCILTARIIHVSSAASITGRLDPSNWDLNMKRGEYSASLQYSNSKLAQVLYSNELNRRTSSTVESVSLHPGRFGVPSTLPLLVQVMSVEKP